MKCNVYICACKFHECSNHLLPPLIGETPESLFKGKLVTCTVVGIVRRKPPREVLDRANPIENKNTAYWQCPFCLKDDFRELSMVSTRLCNLPEMHLLINGLLYELQCTESTAFTHSGLMSSLFIYCYWATAHTLHYVGGIQKATCMYFNTKCYCFQ